MLFTSEMQEDWQLTIDEWKRFQYPKDIKCFLQMAGVGLGAPFYQETHSSETSNILLRFFKPLNRKVRSTRFHVKFPN